MPVPASRPAAGPRCRGRRAPRGDRPRTRRRTPAPRRPTSAASRSTTSRMSGAEPRLGCATGALPGRSPTRVVESGPAGDGGGGGAQLVGIRIAGVDDARRQRMGGEDHLGATRASGPAVRRPHRPGSRRAPARSAHDSTPVLASPCDLAALPSRSRYWPTEIGRVVRRQHQPDHAFEPVAGQLGHRRLDRRVGVLEPEHHAIPAGGKLVERRLQGGLLGSRAFEQWREAADRLVATGEVGQLLVAGRATTPDVGVVGEDLVGRRWRPVRHQHHADPLVGAVGAVGVGAGHVS